MKADDLNFTKNIFAYSWGGLWRHKTTSLFYENSVIAYDAYDVIKGVPMVVAYFFFSFSEISFQYRDFGVSIVQIDWKTTKLWRFQVLKPIWRHKWRLWRHQWRHDLKHFFSEKYSSSPSFWYMDGLNRFRNNRDIK